MTDGIGRGGMRPGVRTEGKPAVFLRKVAREGGRAGENGAPGAAEVRRAALFALFAAGKCGERAHIAADFEGFLVLVRDMLRTEAVQDSGQAASHACGSGILPCHRLMRGGGARAVRIVLLPVRTARVYGNANTALVYGGGRGL